jgi:hypothetical protein
VNSNLPRDWSELAYRIRNSASAQMWIVVAVAVTFFLVMKFWSAGSCEHNSSSTCGVGIFVGEAFGFIGAFIIFIGAGARVLYVDLKRRRARPVRVKDKSAADEAHDSGAALFQERLAEDTKAPLE